MDTKLTLKLDKNVIESAKEYAAKQKVSVSSIVESYFKTIISKENKNDSVQISDFVKSLSLENGGIPADFDYKKDRQEYLIKKYNSL
ncbi:hypothetical protein J2X31_002672 [Flavobacterium arsenatis]|uniref:Antitoxin n=1 Tax=Flavobacterium arsenatis TaxID=1484332 RepID=A0ABU1TS17_9FLAO|nr:DUF6364 family protein [Flavobacterium arsenatis]MDR6968646.1 hypothetical protein [Flavobacterium arsenatis]